MRGTRADGEDSRPITFGDLYTHGHDFFCAVEHDRVAGELFPKQLIRRIMKGAATTERKWVEDGEELDLKVDDAIQEMIILIINQTTRFQVQRRDRDHLGKYVKVHFRGFHIEIILTQSKYLHNGSMYLDVKLTFDPVRRNAPLPNWVVPDSQGVVFAITFWPPNGTFGQEYIAAVFERLINATEALPNDCTPLRSVLLELMFGGNTTMGWFDGTFKQCAQKNTTLTRKEKDVRLEAGKELFLEHMLWKAFCSPVGFTDLVRLLDAAV
jgi:hypothetical protein